MKAIRLAIIGILILSTSLTSALGNVITAAPSAALPGKIESQRLRWRGKTIKIAISSSLTRASSNMKTDSDVVGAIRRSLEAWSNAADIDLQMEYSERQNVSQNGPAGDGVSLVTIAQTPENVLFFAKDADSASAKTRIFYTRKGAITEADIVLNPFQQFSTDGTFGTFDLESTLTHEIGHLLGLHHTGVLGATMAESFAKNGTMGYADFSPRTLAGSDVAAIRDLYGVSIENEDCCGVISGKLVFSAGRPGKGLQVWAEDAESGSVYGLADSGPDGVFRVGGLPSGEYSLYWKTKDTLSASSVGQLGRVTLESGESKMLNERIVSRRSEVAAQYLGLNGQLADYGISLSGGRSYLVNVGGRNLEAGPVSIRFSSPFIRISSQFPVTSQEFSDGVSGISFTVVVDPDIPAGQYSIFLDGENEPLSCLVGAVNIE